MRAAMASAAWRSLSFLPLVLSKQMVQRLDVGGRRSHRLSLRDEEIAGVAIRHLDLVAGSSQFFHLLQ